MLTSFPQKPASAENPACWIDLLNPGDDEKASVEAFTGLRLPSRQSLSAIESSSRVSDKGGVLFMNMPAVSHMSGLDEPASPVGFMLDEHRLVTIRYSALRSFEAVARRFTGDEAPVSGIETFTALVDEMVDVSADLLEGIATELESVSRSVFSTMGRATNATRSNDELRALLTTVGKAGSQLSHIRDSLLALHRIIPFVSRARREWIPQGIKDRFATQEADVVSLNEYEGRLTDHVQFLLDAVLGFISTKQNDIFQRLTVISTVGIPPTLVASIYGMNFKNMPELSWAWGYQWGLALIVLSAVLPLLWFKRRKWLSGDL